MAFQDAFVSVASDKDMTFDMVKVWLYLLGNVGFENWVAKPQMEIADSTGIHKVNVSKAIKALCKKGLILKGPKLGRTTSLKINSKYAWKGKIKHLAKDRVVDFFSEQQKREKLP